MVEKTQYDVLKTYDNIEIRRYPSMLLAIVKDYTDDSGFNLLFNYISGNNRTQQKIQMTTPVITSEKIPMTAPVITKDKYIAFILPTLYTKETIPIPKDNAVHIQQQKEKIYAVFRFRGKTTEKHVQQQFKRLLYIVKNHNLIIKGSPILMRYNSPFAPGFIRRNEVAVEIENI
jgi:hypothetical protein